MAKFSFRRHPYQTPEKPKTQTARIDMLWEYCVNYLPHKLDKIDFEMTLIRWALALLAALAVVGTARNFWG